MDAAGDGGGVLSGREGGQQEGGTEPQGTGQTAEEAAGYDGMVGHRAARTLPGPKGISASPRLRFS